MLFLLSPAKALDYEAAAPVVTPTDPLFVPQSQQLIEVLRGYSPLQISELMDLSDKLAQLNVARYEAWSPTATPANARPAVFAFDGDVYGGLDARNLDKKALQWVEQHVCVLSGLYGVLRPFDLMQPYRLEMGTKLANPRGKDLYAFWKQDVVAYVNQRLQDDAEPVVINVASQEYFKALDTKALQAPVVECVFQEYKAGTYKIISFMAKRARGLMVRFAAQNGLHKAEQLRAFDAEGYAWCAEQSAPERLVFRRRQA